jgi:tRNA nucleotidyltransferase (CCA-adding enzyme)
LLDVQPDRPSVGFDLARRRPPFELVLARALGAEWLDRYLSEWSRVELEIDGGDLIAAGIPEGTAIGRGLGQALKRKLDGEISGREAELEAALAAARGERA